MMPDLILEMRHIDKRFPGVHALDDVNFSVRKGEVHCLIGANGAGKSTLMKILAGAYNRDCGEIIFDGKPIKEANPVVTRKCGISVVYQELSLVNELTVTENILLNNLPRNSFGVDWKAARKKAVELIKQLGVEIAPDVLAGDLSIGSRQLVELMKCLAADSKLIVMDEPSATLSKDEFNTLLRITAELKKEGMTIIYISHRLEELFLVGDRVTVLKDGKFVVTENIKDINIDKLVEYMIGYRMTANTEQRGGAGNSKNYLLQAKNFVNKRLKDVSIDLMEKEIVGLYGLVGAGRTELLRAIYGVDKIKSGELYLKGKPVVPKSARESIKNGIGMLPENRKMQGLVLGLPVWNNICMVAIKRFRRMFGLSYAFIGETSKKYIQDLSIKTPSENTPVVSLSGGNQQKVILAKWLLQKSNILLVDEPTQGIDVEAKAAIYKILRKATEDGSGVIIASAELSELKSICDRIFVMFQGKIVGQFEKNEIQESVILQYAVVGK